MSDVVTEPVADMSEGVESVEETSSSAEGGEEDFTQWKAKQGRTKSEESTDEKVPEEKPAEAKVWRLKVDGKEVEIDPTDKAHLQRLAQMGLASQKKFQEAAQARQKAENFVKMLRENPLEVLKHPSLGLNFRELAENYLYEQLQEEAIPPEERQAKAEREELERYRRAEQERQQQEQTAQQEELKERYRQDYQAKFIEALNNSGLPRSDWTITRMATYMRQAIQSGMTNVTPQDVAHLVKQDWVTAQREMYGSLDADKLIEVLGQDVVDKIGKHRAEKFKAQSQGTRPGKVGQSSSKTSSKRSYTSIYDMVEDLD